MRLCTYTVRKDSGFAPNPFWGYCTLAACTPNHQGVRLEPGDWLAGFAAKSRGGKLIYSMLVSEVLSFDAYYRDNRRFACKKPPKNGDWRQLCGDNIYFRDKLGQWCQVPNLSHEPERVAQDTKYPRVFIAEQFYYFGENAVAAPDRFAALRKKFQGCKCNHSPRLVGEFLNWLQSSFKPGRYGKPKDLPLTAGLRA